MTRKSLLAIGSSECPAQQTIISLTLIACVVRHLAPMHPHPHHISRPRARVDAPHPQLVPSRSPIRHISPIEIAPRAPCPSSRGRGVRSPSLTSRDHGALPRPSGSERRHCLLSELPRC